MKKLNKMSYMELNNYLVELKNESISIENSLKIKEVEREIEKRRGKGRIEQTVGIRIVTPKPFRNISGFSDDKGNKKIETIEEAKKVIDEFDRDMDNYKFGEQYLGKCKAVRVTEIIEELKLD